MIFSSQIGEEPLVELIWNDSTVIPLDTQGTVFLITVYQ